MFDTNNFIEFASFQLNSVKSDSIDPRLDIPQIEVTFTNGLKQKMILRHYDAIPNSDLIDQSRICNYLGHLEGDETDSTVAVTGCLLGDNPDEKVHITLLSQHSPLHKTFSMDRKGNVKHIEIETDEGSNQGLDEELTFSEKKTALRGSSKWKACGDDSWINEELEAAAAEVTPTQRDTVPSTLTLKFRLGIDQDAKNYLERRGLNVDNWLSSVMTHAQSHYTHSSLQHKIVFQVIQ